MHCKKIFYIFYLATIPITPCSAVEPLNSSSSSWNLFLPAILAGASDNTLQTVTSLTGRVWMDRNLGASQVATSINDTHAFGDLYQWGRLTDGHEKRTSGITSTLSSTDNPNHDKFIIAPSSPKDWRSPQNDNLWQGVNGKNNPCPAGFRLPTISEWAAEVEKYGYEYNSLFNSPLKLPAAGLRGYADGSLYEGFSGYYWSSTIIESGVRYLGFDQDYGTSAEWMTQARSNGFRVRCIKN